MGDAAVNEFGMPVRLERGNYDRIMAKRLQRKCGSRNLAEVLKVAIHWRHLASVHHVAARYEGTTSAHPKAMSLVAEDEEFHNTLRHLSREDAIVAGKELLQQRCAFLGLRQHDMVDDGNCQFRAISQELFGSQKYHEVVRAQVLSYLKQHKADFAEFFADEEWSEYLETMAKPRTWGDEMSLRAAAEAFAVTIHVLTSSEENWLLEYSPKADSDKGAREVFLTYVAPIHYNSVEALR
eukprot:gnl/MRDRNA2_/MRDRNA2_249568_c0_seq1.p1 gnl/MRDRNA2_/MRDRNA2_249568_c0~~gnl/MRDRNA2_/MRDRNA2_249568_c0_seq1.p1  ORF type:complete len:280 (-),score=45.98 gnl/MRDRNA2_/MRDRNA2_249568_c0_seq1:62-775(-)